LLHQYVIGLLINPNSFVHRAERIHSWRSTQITLRRCFRAVC
jgi:hypothetical protein